MSGYYRRYFEDEEMTPTKERRIKHLPIDHSERRKAMPVNGETTVKFRLWPVLGFLVLLVGIGMGYLFTAQGENRDESRMARQVLSERITKIEVNYTFIVTGIERLEKNQSAIMDILLKQKKARGE